MRSTAQPRKTPRQDRSRQTVEAIVEAGARILAEEGYARFTTNRVAELAGVSIGSLYQYFANKDSLICAIFERHQARVRETISGSFDHADELSSLSDVRCLIASVVEAHSVEPKLHARFEALRNDGNLPAELGTGELGKIAERLEHMLRSRSGGDIEDARLTSWVLVTTVHALIQAHERGGPFSSRAQLIDEISRVVFGYVGLKGQQ